MSKDMLKRGFDVIVCILAAPLTVTVCLLIGVIYAVIERESPIFKQIRIGRHEKQFKIIKLRTMKVTTEEKGTHQVDKSSVTTIGAFLRATKLDELPQLWNVFLGQMSLVGPRPGLVGQTELTNERRKLDVFSVRPGITGSSQLDGIDMSTPKLLAESDARYIQNSNFFLDFKIIIRTALGKGAGDKIR